MADYVTADVINVQSEGIAQESSLISGRVTTPRIELDYGFYIDQNGMHCATAGIPTSVIAIDKNGIGVQEIFGAQSANGSDRAQMCASAHISGSRHDGADDCQSVVTSRDVIACCARRPEDTESEPLAHFASNIVRVKRLSVREHIAVPVSFARVCHIRTSPAPIILRENATITLPPAGESAGKVMEYLPCAGVTDAIIIATNGDQYRAHGQSITFVSDGTQWFALDANGLKYIC